MQDPRLPICTSVPDNKAVIEHACGKPALSPFSTVSSSGAGLCLSHLSTLSTVPGTHSHRKKQSASDGNQHGIKYQ